MNNAGRLTSNRQNWATPKALFDELNAKYNFTTDVAASDENHLCQRYFTAERSALAEGAQWSERPGDWWFCNPVYTTPEKACKPNCKKKRCQPGKKTRGHCIDKDRPGQIDFIREGLKQARAGHPGVMLIPVRTDTAMWHRYIFDAGASVQFLKGRLYYDDGPTPAPFPSAVVVFR